MRAARARGIGETPMAYDEELADRVREALGEHDVGLSERRMFGGLAFMANGHMACGVLGDDLMVRVGKDHHEDALAQPHAREMDFTGRPSSGMVYVAPAGTRSDADLAGWVRRGLDHVATLPPRS